MLLICPIPSVFSAMTIITITWLLLLAVRWANKYLANEPFSTAREVSPPIVSVSQSSFQPSSSFDECSFHPPFIFIFAFSLVFLFFLLFSVYPCVSTGLLILPFTLPLCFQWFSCSFFLFTFALTLIFMFFLSIYFCIYTCLLILPYYIPFYSQWND